jgi:hypothetical protein
MMSEFFLTGSSLFALASLFFYFRQVVNGSSVPNPATWFLWAVVSIMNAVSYFFVVHGNIWRSSYVIVMAAGLTIIFFYSLLKGRLARFGRIEIVCSLLAVFVGILWKTTGSAEVANISLQTIFLVSIIPTINGLIVGTLKEKVLPWNLAVLSHSFALLGILLGGTFSWVTLVYPVVTGIFGNGVVPVIVYLQRTKSHL